MKVLITGFPGTGKSSIAHELKLRGYNAYDPEAMRGYMHLQDINTGRPVQIPEHPMRGWFDTYGAFNWDITRLTRLLGQSKAKTVFICSLADNIESLYALFDRVFVLVLDDFELENRLRSRSKFIDTNPEMLADTLMLHRHFEQSLLNQGANAINVHANIKTVTDHILQQCWDGHDS